MTKYDWTKLLPPPIRRRVEGRDKLVKTFSNIGWLLFDRLFRLGVGLVVGVWVARYLGPEQFGTLNYASAFVALFAPLISLGLDSIVVRDIVKNPEEAPQILGTTFILKLTGSVITLLLCLIISLILDPADGLKIWMVILFAGATLFQAFDAIDFWFQSQLQSKYTVFARNATFVIMSSVRIVLLLLKAPLLAFGVVALVEASMVAAGLFLAYRYSGQRIRQWQINFEQARYLLRSSGFLIVSSVAVAIYMKIDQVMLEALVGSKEVGIYSAAVRISEIWYFVPLAIVNSIFPTIVRSKEISQELYYNRVYRLFKWMCLMAYLVALVVTFLADWVIRLLFGAGYAEAGPILALHVWSGVFVILGVAQGPWDVTENLTQLTFWRSIGGAVINIGLNFWLIPAFQAYGAALATITAYAFSAYIFNAFSAKTRPIFIIQTRSLLLLPIK